MTGPAHEEPTAPAREWWDERRRAYFAELADVLIPAEGTMLAASAAGTATRGLDLVLRARPDLDGPLRAAVTQESGPPAQPAAEVVAGLAAAGGGTWQALTMAVSAAYYSDPAVRQLIGYPGQEARKVDPFEYTRYVADGLLDGVVARGPRYQTPRADQAATASSARVDTSQAAH
jgi:hypothetical protein